MTDGKYINEDLKRERNNPPFDLEALAVAIYGKEMYPKLNKLHRLFAKNENLDLRHTWSCDNKTRYILACRIAEELADLARKHNLLDDPELVGALQVMVGEEMFLLLHLTMFMCTLEAMCNEEQAKHWMPLARDFRILGTYAQTELSHGSNVSRLETEAVFDEETDEFVLNTPSLTARKWWVGGLAKSCTHCILMARLKIKGKDWGVHPFILQVRDLNDHKSLPGVTLLHIGQKIGYQGVDNGSLHLKNVRIPRKNLLMRFCEVDRDGTYRTTRSRKLLYSTLTFTRKQIIRSAGAHLSRSIVVAIRYSAVRRQFASLGDADGAEQQVLNYSTTQRTLLPLLGMSIAFIQTGQWTDELYRAFKVEADRDVFDRLEEVHLVTSCLKAYMTLAAAEGIEQCRRACGGHGYLQASGVSLHLVSYLPQVTYEGDFVILSLQAGRLLLKVVGNRMAGNIPSEALTSSVRHLYTFDFDSISEVAVVTREDLLSFNWMIKAFEKRASVLVYMTAQRFSSLGGPSSASAFEAIKVDLTKMTVAHAQLLIVRNCLSSLERLQREGQQSVQRVLECLFRSLALAWLDDHLAEFLIAKAANVESHTLIKETLADACAEARKTAVLVADAFGHSDNFLNSALGRYDGDVYRALFDSTKLDSLNQQDVSESYKLYIQYILHPERKTARPKL
ncbi:acyl-coenzyme A oxidase, putative [Eimeria necatrix]|uniref:Acyl-coenzyme A oxidase n=1 Tax=Eimeria necatrix TaxID=51315 RepID=U6MXC8_9EIME|nr:acyl-coenzyme A oxidase, putative [Eimeria necatrix]CDJ67673.1 acyl-coenzyme A oxidase, putative [Eimeria necatrix]